MLDQRFADTGLCHDSQIDTRAVVDKEISEAKLSMNARARIVAESYLSTVSPPIPSLTGRQTHGLTRSRTAVRMIPARALFRGRGNQRERESERGLPVVCRFPPFSPQTLLLLLFRVSCSTIKHRVCPDPA